MIAGRLDFGSFAVGTVLPFINQNQIKVLAVVQPKPSTLLPGVKTTAEQGFPGIDARIGFFLFAPKGTPEPMIIRLSSTLNEVTTNPEISAKLLQLGFEPLKVGPDEGAALFRQTADHWAPVIKRLNIKID